MKTEDKKMIYDHLVLTTSNYLPMEALELVCDELTRKRSLGAGIFEILYDLEKDSTLNIFKNPSNGAFYSTDNSGQQIMQLDKKGELVATHNTISDAARSLGDVGKKTKISEALSGVRKSAYKFQWVWGNGNISLF